MTAGQPGYLAHRPGFRAAVEEQVELWSWLRLPAELCAPDLVLDLVRGELSSAV